MQGQKRKIGRPPKQTTAAKADDDAGDCYCNGTKHFNRPTVECQKCHRLFHDECIQCLSERIMLGDTLFLFLCATCNSGYEHLSRIELTWQDIVHLLLYNRTKLTSSKYHTVEQLLRYFNEVKYNLYLSEELENQKDADCHKHITKALSENSKIFRNAREIRKSMHLWALRIKEPIKPPAVSRKKYDTGQGGRWKCPPRTVVVLSHKHEYVKIVPTRKRPMIEGSKTGISNGVGKGGLVKKRKLQNATDETPKKEPPNPDVELTGIVGLLDKLIPTPPKFEKSYHPFWVRPKRYKIPTDINFIQNGEGQSKSSSSATESPAKQPEGEKCTVLSKKPKIDIKQYLYNNMRPLTKTRLQKRPLEAFLGLQNTSKMKTRRSNNNGERTENDFSIIGRREFKGKVQYLVEQNW